MWRGLHKKVIYWVLSTTMPRVPTTRSCLSSSDGSWASTRKSGRRQEDVHIVIFPCGKPNAKRWAAIGQDADRLFEVFGWQTGHVEATTGPVSWMFINGYGLDVLRQSGYSIQIRDFGEFDILSTAFEEDSVASLQQFIDYLRMMGEMADEQVKFLRKIRPVIYPHPGYFELTQARLDFGRNTVVAKFRVIISIARQVATVASRLRFDALPPHALRTSLRMLHFALSSMTARAKPSS